MPTTQEATNGVFRVGVVKEYDAKRHMARVEFPGMAGLVSEWLPAVVPFSSGNKAEIHIDKGSHAACLMAGEGAQSGIIIGSFYDDTNQPSEGNPDVTVLEFSDGTKFRYDRAGHSLSIDCTGDISVRARGNVSITGANIYLN